MAELHPIETAPMDGTPILAFSPALGFVVCRYAATPADSTKGLFSRWLVLWDCQLIALLASPTHWMPLPEPPK